MDIDDLLLLIPRNPIQFILHLSLLLRIGFASGRYAREEVVKINARDLWISCRSLAELLLMENVTSRCRELDNPWYGQEFARGSCSEDCNRYRLRV